MQAMTGPVLATKVFGGSANAWAVRIFVECARKPLLAAHVGRLARMMLR